MRLLIKFIFLLALIGASLLGSFWWWANQPIHLRNSPLDFRIVSGSSLRSAINQMQEAGVSVHPTLLELTAKLNKAETGIKAGSYSIKQGITPLGLIEKLLQGKVSLGQTTLIEGWTLRQWRQKIASNLFHPRVRDGEILRSEQSNVKTRMNHSLDLVLHTCKQTSLNSIRRKASIRPRVNRK